MLKNDRIEGGDVANEQNLKRLSPSEAREYGRKGGKASGESRRRKANLREAANLLLTTEINHPEWTNVLKGMGLYSTLEYAVIAAITKEAMDGNVSAYRALMDTVGQTDKSETDLQEQQSKTELNQAKKQSLTGENESNEALQKLDEILKGVYENAAKQEAE